MDLLNNIGAIITMLMGFLGLFLPKKASELTGLSPVTPAGRAEFRGTLGVTFIFLGLVPLATQNDIAFLTVGLCWLGAAIGRVISIFLDQGNQAQNWIAVGFECAIAALLLVGLSVSV
jgi:hypothetical protein